MEDAGRHFLAKFSLVCAEYKLLNNFFYLMCIIFVNFYLVFWEINKLFVDFLQISLLHIVGELAEGASVTVGVSDMWQVYSEIWHPTHDTWNVTHDTWHLTHDTWFIYLFFIFLLNFIWIFILSVLLCAPVKSFSVSYMGNPEKWPEFFIVKILLFVRHQAGDQRQK